MRTPMDIAYLESSGFRLVRAQAPGYVVLELAGMRVQVTFTDARVLANTILGTIAALELELEQTERAKHRQ